MYIFTVFEQKLIFALILGKGSTYNSQFQKVHQSANNSIVSNTKLEPTIF